MVEVTKEKLGNPIFAADMILSMVYFYEDEIFEIFPFDYNIILKYFLSSLVQVGICSMNNSLVLFEKYSLSEDKKSVEYYINQKLNSFFNEFLPYEEYIKKDFCLDYFKAMMIGVAIQNDIIEIDKLFDFLMKSKAENSQKFDESLYVEFEIERCDKQLIDIYKVFGF